MDDDQEEGHASFDAPLVAAQEAVTCPCPSNLQVVAGAGLIEDQDSVAPFDPRGTAAVAHPAAPGTWLVAGAKANPLPQVLPAGTGLASNSADSRSARSSVMWSTVSCASRLSKVHKMEQLMHLIASKMDRVPASSAAVVQSHCFENSRRRARVAR